MLARGSALIQQPSPRSSNDEVVGDGLDRDDIGNDMCEGDSKYEFIVGLNRRQEPSGDVVAQQEAFVTQGPEVDNSSIMNLQQPLAPLALEIPQDTSLLFDPSWRGNTGEQVQTYQELPTPHSDCLSWFDSFEGSTSTSVAGSHLSRWTDTPYDEQYYYPNSEPFDVGFLDMPGSSDDSKSNEHMEGSGSNTPWKHEKKGSVTLTLSQVDSDVAQEIMGSVLKHSSGLKIRCIVNDG